MPLLQGRARPSSGSSTPSAAATMGPSTTTSSRNVSPLKSQLRWVGAFDLSACESKELEAESQLAVVGVLRPHHLSREARRHLAGEEVERAHDPLVGQVGVADEEEHVVDADLLDAPKRRG